MHFYLFYYLKFNKIISKIFYFLYLIKAYLGDYEITKFLLKHPKIDVDFCSEPSNYTPLQLATITGNFELVQMLLGQKK